MRQSGTVPLEPAEDAAFFSHFVRVADYGQDRTTSDTIINASELKPVSGNLRLMP